MKHRTLLAFLLFLTPLALRADETEAAVDSLVKPYMKLSRIPGLSVVVTKEGKILLAKGYGLANIEHNVPAKPETVYQSGSVGKQFTATAVMMLVEDGKLKLDDPISQYLDGTPETWKAITIHHLLTHTSGVKTYGPKDLNLQQDYTEAELLKKAISLPLDFPPGEKWSYSNTGYVLLGLIIRKASGEFYGDYLRRRIFEPLGMTTARIINEPDIIPNRAAGYQLVKRQIKNQDWVSPSLNTTSDGSLYLTVLDMAKWDAALHTEKLLKKASLDQMWTPVKTKDGQSHPYGFGWGVNESKGRKTVHHNGVWQGFSTSITRQLNDKVSVVVLTNLAEGNPERLADAILAKSLEPAEKK